LYEKARLADAEHVKTQLRQTSIQLKGIQSAIGAAISKEGAKSFRCFMDALDKMIDDEPSTKKPENQGPKRSLIHNMNRLGILKR